MTAVVAICVAVTFGVGVYLLLGRELKELAMGAFLLGHAANLSILAMSRSPIAPEASGGPPTKSVPVADRYAQPAEPLAAMVAPLPQALILTAIVIGFAMMAFLLALIVTTGRKTETLSVDELAREQLPTPSQAH